MRSVGRKGLTMKELRGSTHQRASRSEHFRKGHERTDTLTRSSECGARETGAGSHTGKRARKDLLVKGEVRGAGLRDRLMVKSGIAISVTSTTNPRGKSEREDSSEICPGTINLPLWGNATRSADFHHAKWLGDHHFDRLSFSAVQREIIPSPSDNAGQDGAEGRGKGETSRRTH